MGVYTDYFQKSKVFLYPLLKLGRGLTFVPKQTYIAWENVYSSEDRMFMCEYHTTNNKQFGDFVVEKFLSHPMFQDVLELEEKKQLVIFNLNKLKFDYDYFIQGRYSRFSIDGKIKIQDFFGEDSKTGSYTRAFLSPAESHEEYADYFGVDEELIKEVYEICTPPDMKKETLVDNNYELHKLLENNYISLTK